MHTVSEVQPDIVLSGPLIGARARWRLGTRLAFRFCAVHVTYTSSRRR
jgi:hypothetical protein